MATYPRDDDILGCLRELVLDSQYVKLWITFSCYASNFFIVNTIINNIMIYPGAVLGVCLYGWFLKYTKMFRAAHIMVGLSSIVALGLLLLAFELENDIFIKSAYALYGLWWGPTFILSLTFLNEVWLTIKETTSTGFFWLGAYVVSLGFSYLCTFFREEFGERYGSFYCFGVMMGIKLIGILCSFLLKPIEYKRELRNFSVDEL